MNILAIDPGSTESAFVLWDGEIASDYGKVENEELLYNLSQIYISPVLEYR